VRTRRRGVSKAGQESPGQVSKARRVQGCPWTAFSELKIEHAVVFIF
jgi:hypothetical protein